MNDEQLKAIRERWEARTTPLDGTARELVERLTAQLKDLKARQATAPTNRGRKKFSTLIDGTRRALDGFAVDQDVQDVLSLLEHIDAQAERLRKLEAERAGLIEAVWRTRSLWNETAIMFADAVGLDVNEHMELLTPLQRSKWTDVYDFMFRLANPHLRTDSTPGWTPFADIVAGVDEDTAHGG